MSKCGRPKERNDGGGVKSIIIIDPPLPDHFSLVVAGSRGVKPASRKFEVRMEDIDIGMVDPDLGRFRSPVKMARKALEGLRKTE